MATVYMKNRNDAQWSRVVIAPSMADGLVQWARSAKLIAYRLK